MKVVRWLGAFKKESNLYSSLKWELEQKERFELAAEPLVNGISAIHHSKIGLLVKRTAILKVFKGDCFSVKVGDTGKLKKTRNPRSAYSEHREAWVKPYYVGIVIQGWGYLRPHVKKTLLWFAETYSLKILILKKGRLLPLNK